MDENQKNEFIKLFIQTASEHISEMKSILTRLHTDTPDMSMLIDFHRLAHSLKGECRALGYESTARLSHLLEIIFYQLKNNSIVLTPQLVVDVATCVDELETSVARIASVRSENDLKQTISQFEQRTGVQLPEEQSS